MAIVPYAWIFLCLQFCARYFLPLSLATQPDFVHFQYSSVGSPFTGASNKLIFLSVYPETKGIPLEEMDAVFGEGPNLPVVLESPHTDLFLDSGSDEEESETSPLVQGRLPSHAEEAQGSGNAKEPQASSFSLRGVWDRLQGRTTQQDYEPIREGEE